MAKRVDLIKGLIRQSEIQSFTKRGDKKRAGKLVKQLKKKFNELLNEPDDFVFKADIINLLSSRSANSYITSNFFPKNMKEYGSYRNIIDFTKDIKLEMRWLAYCLQFYSRQISEFVELREQYDKYVLLNRYEDALNIIKNVEKKFGLSLWSMEGKFFLYAKMEINNKELIDQIPQSIFGCVMDFYELKNRENVTGGEYFYIANKEINRAKKYITDADDILEYYAYKITSLEYILTERKIPRLLYVIRQTSLIDRYLFFIDVCDYIISKPQDFVLRSTLKDYILLLEEIQDDHLIAIRFILDTTENRIKKYKLKTRLEHAKCEFIKGKVETAKYEAAELLEEFPSNISAMNLYVEASVLLGNQEEICEENNLGIILKNLAYIYTLHENRDDCVDAVKQLANACSQSTWAKEILNVIVYRCQEYGKDDYRRSEILSNIQHLDIETVMSCFRNEKNFAQSGELIDQENPYIKFRYALLNKDYQMAMELCSLDQIRDILIISNENISIEEKMLHLRKIEGRDASFAVLAMRNFLSTADLDKYLEVVMKLSTELIISNIFTSLFIPLRKIIDYINRSGNNIRANICTPILYYVYATYFNRDKLDDLGIICEDFFLFRDIERPTKIDLNNEEYGQEKVIYFLKNVCSTKIMDISVPAFTNSQERDKERVEICNILCRIDPTNQKEYEKEIREVTQKLMINAELKTIEENRIHVNVDGMKDRLEKSYKNDFLRYQFYQDKRIQHLTLALEGEITDKLQIIQDTPERILRELVFHIRDAFVSSDEYGLNGYLSLNIRHGTLEDELRSPLYKAYLNAKKDIHTGTYTINPHWTNFADPNDLRSIEKAITDFHMKTEAIISKLKNEYIQIKTEEKGTNGVFDYRLSEGHMLKLIISIANVTTFEEFLDIVINYLWQITEHNLYEIKRIIKDEIAQDYNCAFEELKTAISGINNKAQLRELQQKIAEASTDMPNTLDKICYWFQRSTESKHNDFDLQFAFNLGLQTIKNMHPEQRFTDKMLQPSESDKIPGEYLKNFDGIFYNLFDNIYKKAAPADGRGIEIRYKLKYKEQKYYIYIENDFDCTKDISDDEARVEDAKELIRSEEYLKKVKGEGGTGIPKIVKILVYDLNRKPDIDFGYIKERNVFFMKIEF